MALFTRALRSPRRADCWGRSASNDPVPLGPSNLLRIHVFAFHRPILWCKKHLLSERLLQIDGRPKIFSSKLGADVKVNLCATAC